MVIIGLVYIVFGMNSDWVIVSCGWWVYVVMSCWMVRLESIKVKAVDGIALT